jgi:diadenosine tetraphosphate (Ap4A) HIT family hydrolase
MFVPPPELIICETNHWRVNQSVDASLPGYLIVGARDPAAKRFEDLSDDALAKLGALLRDAVQILESTLGPRHVYVSRFGHTPGHSVHFHIIPVYAWVIEAFKRDIRYRILEQFHCPGFADQEFDGCDMSLFICREFAESLTPPRSEGPKMDTALELLKKAFAERSY